MTRRFLLLLSVSLAANVALSTGAQEPKPAPEPELQMTFWDSGDGERAQLVANLVLLRNPFAIVALRQWASEYPLLPDWEYVTHLALPLPERLLHMIEDGTEAPDFGGQKPLTPSDWAFYAIYNKALMFAADTPEENFRRSAEEHANVQFPLLFERPAQYRGKVVPVQGTLLVLRQYPAPKIAENEGGIRHVYEAWIKMPTKRSGPVCVTIVELPEGLKPGEDMDREVKFYGYFLKKMKYQAADAKRLTLQFVGRTLEVERPVAAAPQQPFSRFVLFTIAGAALILTALIVVFTVWFRRGDVRVSARIDKLRQAHGLDFEDVGEPPPLATPVGEPPPLATRVATPAEPGPVQRDGE